MAEIYDLETYRAQSRCGKEKERTGGRPIAPAQGDQVVISFEAGRATLECWKAREGVKKHPAYTLGRRSVSPASEQTERLRGRLENQIIQELAAIQAAGKAQNADTLNQSAAAGQELGGTARARQEEIDRQRWQRVEENLAAEQRRRKALRETAGWVYLPELLQFLKQGRGEQEKRFSLKPPENETSGLCK